MTTWEYRTEIVDESGMYDAGSTWRRIDEIGADGWELVSVGNWRGSEATAFFKRMLPERVGAVKA